MLAERSRRQAGARAARMPCWVGLALLLLPSVSVVAQCSARLDIGRGPVAFHVPRGYDPERPTPLVVGLHGYGSDGRQLESYLRILPLAEEEVFLYAFPEGTPDVTGRRFWDAEEACCGAFGPDVDDSAYLRRLLETIKARCNVDPKRIFFIGHSNGAYMSYRMACDHAETITGIVALAGVTSADPADCSPSKPVHVLHVHGTADEIWDYDGGTIRDVTYPGAPATAAAWSFHDGCPPEVERPPGLLDLDECVPGAESSVLRYAGPCRPGGSVELWTIDGADHTPCFPPGFTRAALGHLFARPLECAGSERVARAVCRRRSSTLRLRLGGGLAEDVYRVELGDGRVVTGRLDRRGRATARFGDMPAGEGTASVAWGCTAAETVGYSCPPPPRRPGS